MAKRLNVIIVDDDNDYARSTQTLVGLLGHDARAFTCGAAALRECDALVPDVILADIGMPGMDGYEFANRIRGSEILRSTVLVAVTGHSADEHRVRAIDAGFDYRFVKPMEPDELRDFLQLIASKS